MLKNLNIKFILLMLAFLFIFTVPVSADIYDEADIFTESEEKELLNLLEKKEDEIKANLVIITTTSNGDVEELTKSKFRKNIPNEYPGSITYGIQITSIDEYGKFHGNTTIIGFDEMSNIKVSNEASIQVETDNLLKAGNYSKAAIYFINNINESIKSQKTVQTLITLGINLLIATAVMFVTVFNAGGKITVTHNNYLKLDKSRIFNQRDIYLRTTITKTKKASSSGSGKAGNSSRGSF